MLEAPWLCTILCFLFTTLDWISWCYVSIGRQVQNDRNAIECCAQSGPKKLTKTYNKGFPNDFTLITMLYCIHLCFMFSLATPPTVEEILDKMNYDLVMSLTVEAPVSTIYRWTNTLVLVVPSALLRSLSVVLLKCLHV